MSDTYRFDIASEGREHFDRAMLFAFERALKGTQHKAVGYKVIPEKGLVFFWHDPNHIKFVEFPFVMGVEAATDFAWHWLLSQEYEKVGNFDGTTHKGFRVYNESWGHVASDHYAFAAVKPEWMLYGK